MRGARVLVAAVLVGAALTGCSSDDEPAADQPAEERAGETTVAQHCDGRFPDDTGATLTELEGDGIALVAADVPAAAPSGTVLVLLHQTGGLGLCGWSRWAPLAAAAGLPSVAIDMCGYGGSDCPESTPPEEQVALAADHAREALGAQRVVVVGASMGGSQAVIAVAHGAEVDGWADISGPDEWDGTTLLEVAPDVRARKLRGLIIHDPADDPEWYAAAQSLAGEASAAIYNGESGHGWELLTDSQGTLRPDGQRVIDWVLENFRR